MKKSIKKKRFKRIFLLYPIIEVRNNIDTATKKPRIEKIIAIVLIGFRGGFSLFLPLLEAIIARIKAITQIIKSITRRPRKVLNCSGVI